MKNLYYKTMITTMNTSVRITFCFVNWKQLLFILSYFIALYVWETQLFLLKIIVWDKYLIYVRNL